MILVAQRLQQNPQHRRNAMMNARIAIAALALAAGRGLRPPRRRS
jgi:hypothetical protein